MSANSMQSEIEKHTDAQPGWRFVVVAGGILVLLGLLAVVFPFVTGLSLSVLLGILLIVGGLVHVAHAFSSFGAGWRGFAWQALLALVYTFAGVSLMANPVLGLTSLTLLLIAYFLVDGVLEIAMGVRLRGEGSWGWVVASGVISLLAAGLLWAGFPASASWAVGLLAGISLLSSGFAMVFYGLGARKAERAEVTPPTTRPRGT